MEPEDPNDGFKIPNSRINWPLEGLLQWTTVKQLGVIGIFMAHYGRYHVTNAVVA